MKTVWSGSYTESLLNFLIVKLHAQLVAKGITEPDELVLTPFLVRGTEIFTASKNKLLFIGIPTPNGIFYLEADPDNESTSTRIYPDLFFGPVEFRPYKPDELDIVINPHLEGINRNNFGIEFHQYLVPLLDTVGSDPFDISEIKSGSDTRHDEIKNEFGNYTDVYISRYLQHYLTEGFPSGVQAGFNI